ncbi:MAG: M48 family metallopeptidase, partial [Pirellulales bacterium]
MQLFSMLTVLAAVAIAEAAPDRPVDHVNPRLTAALVGMLIPVAWAAFVSRRTVRQIRLATASRIDRWRSFRKWETVQTGLCFVFGIAVLYGLGWPQLVRSNWELDRWLFLDDVVILAPAMLPLFVSWLLFYSVDCAIRSTVQVANPRIGRWQYALLRVRCHWLVVLVPVAGLLVLRDTIRWAVPTAVGTPHEWLLSLAYLAAIVFFFPLILKWSWRTEPLPAEPLRRRLEQAASRWNVGVKDFLVWKTGNRVVNAAITGLVPSCRYVILTDGLLRHMTSAEIEAVCAHELGHVDHRHLALRMMAAVGPPVLLYVCARWLIQALAVGGLPIGCEPWMLLASMVPLGAAVYAVTIFGPYARLLEQQADWYACRRL